MIQKIYNHLSLASSMINNSISNGASKDDIIYEIDCAIKQLKELELNDFKLIRDNPCVIRFEIIDCTDLANVFGLELEDDKLNQLKDLIIQNRDKIELPETESLLYMVADRFTYKDVFNNCPEVTDFLDRFQKK